MSKKTRILFYTAAQLAFSYIAFVLFVTSLYGMGYWQWQVLKSKCANSFSRMQFKILQRILRALIYRHVVYIEHGFAIKFYKVTAATNFLNQYPSFLKRFCIELWLNALIYCFNLTQAIKNFIAYLNTHLPPMYLQQFPKLPNKL